MTETNVHVAIDPRGIGTRHGCADQPVIPVVQGQDIDAEEPFKATRNVRLSDDDSAASMNAEAQNKTCSRYQSHTNGMQPEGIG